MTAQQKEQLWLKAMEYGRRCGCHQRADRSFFIGQWQMPVCARCTGVLAGHIIASALLFKRKKLPSWAAVALCGVTFTDWLIQQLGIKESSNPRRLVTGIAGGIGTAVLYFEGIKYVIRTVKKFGHSKTAKGC